MFDSSYPPMLCMACALCRWQLKLMFVIVGCLVAVLSPYRLCRSPRTYSISRVTWLFHAPTGMRLMVRCDQILECCVYLMRYSSIFCPCPHSVLFSVNSVCRLDVPLQFHRGSSNVIGGHRLLRRDRGCQHPLHEGGEFYHERAVRCGFVQTENLCAHSSNNYPSFRFEYFFLYCEQDENASDI